MKALSIRQPWALLIVQGIKDIENRGWSTAYRGDLLIHASRQVDRDAFLWLKERGISLPDVYETGGFIGRAKLVDVVTQSDSSWFRGRYGLVLESARLFSFLPFKGALRLFDVDATLLQRTEEGTHV